MNIAVLIRQVPDLAEELEVADGGTELDREYLTWVVNEFDDHALEEALQLKDSTGGTVTMLGLGTDDIDEALFTALAKGADRAVKVGAVDGPVDSHGAAAAFAEALQNESFDLILTGVQAINDVDGQVGPLVAVRLGLPHVSVVTHIAPADDGTTVTVNQEYAGGVLAEFQVTLPAVLGVQAARAVPRYAPVSRVRQLMKTATLESAAVDVAASGGLTILRMSPPEGSGHAEMIEGDADAVVERLAGILGDRGLLPG